MVDHEDQQDSFKAYHRASRGLLTTGEEAPKEEDLLQASETQDNELRALSLRPGSNTRTVARTGFLLTW